MTECAMRDHLGAYYDGELEASSRREMEAHLESCEACAAELKRMRGLSARIAAASADELDSFALARMHAAIDRADADQYRIRRMFRTAGMLGALAASVLIVSAVWLHELPTSRPGATMSGMAGRVPAQDWERLAVNLRAEPRLDSDSAPFSPKYAEAIDWMLNGLGKTEPKSWEKPG